MKKVVLVVVVLVAGLVAFNYVTTGELSLIPSFSMSEEEQELRDLEKAFRAARKQYSSAGRAAGIAGIDTTADAEAALREVDRLQRDLNALKKRLTSESAKSKAERLETSIREFKRDLR